MTGKLNERPDELFMYLGVLREELLKLAHEVERDSSFDTSRKLRIKGTIFRLIAILAADDVAGHGLKKRLEEVPTKEVHFARNKNMDPQFMPRSPQQALEWGWNDKVAADCHQFTSPDKTNTKYVSPDGKDEVIFDAKGHTVTASEDYGTYNFANPSTDPVGHFYMDVLPWLVWGNDEKDTTDMNQRLKAFVIDGGASAVAGKIAETETAVAGKLAETEVAVARAAKAYMEKRESELKNNTAKPAQS